MAQEFRDLAHRILSLLRRLWPWDRSRCLQVSAWFVVAYVGLLGVKAMYDTASTRTADVADGAAFVAALLVGFAAACTYFLLGALLGPKSYDDEVASVADGLMEMAGRTNVAAIVHRAYSSHRATLAVLNDLLAYAGHALGASPDYDRMLKTPIDNVTGLSQALFAEADDGGSRLDDTRRKALQIAAGYAADLSRSVRSGRVRVVRAPTLPPVRLTSTGEVLNLPPAYHSD